MKRLFISLFLIVACLSSYAQKDSVASANTSVLEEINDAVQSIDFTYNYSGRYKIYQTENIYILIKLDTTTGRISLLQWNLNSEKEFETYLNLEDLSYGGSQKGRFELYPTKNMYQFILLDTMQGGTWHVQWGTKKEQMWIRRISFF